MLVVVIFFCVVLLFVSVGDYVVGYGKLFKYSQFKLGFDLWCVKGCKWGLKNRVNSIVVMMESLISVRMFEGVICMIFILEVFVCKLCEFGLLGQFIVIVKVFEFYYKVLLFVVLVVDVKEVVFFEIVVEIFVIDEVIFVWFQEEIRVSGKV